MRSALMNYEEKVFLHFLRALSMCAEKGEKKLATK